jgi:hypothetical protein
MKCEKPLDDTRIDDLRQAGSRESKLYVGAKENPCAL